MNVKSSTTRTVAVITFALLTIAGTSLLSGSPAPAPDFAYHTNMAVPENLPTDGWTGGPYECDATEGFITSCVFPD